VDSRVAHGIPGEGSLELAVAAKAGDTGARGELIGALFPLIRRTARIYRHSPAVDETELTQEGVVGVLRALDRYDPARGSSFWAYASWWVRQAMQQLVSELTGPVRGSWRLKQASGGNRWRT